ncbi:MAG: hypothetical protein PHO70_07915 [Candidatus Omnitrophica bacterium]|nr:hypothetical protein [Candidatus Omnitrophota bacterium]
MITQEFLDRKTYTDLLNKRLKGLLSGYRQNIAIIGEELVGKTSIIFKFLEKFYDNRIVISYLEIRQESLEYFVKRFIGVLLYNFLINSDVVLKDDINFLIEKSEKYIPKTVEKIKSILSLVKKKKQTEIFTELFSLPEILHSETGKHCVIILDEFLNLEKLGFKNLYREWSKLLITQKHTMYIIVSSLEFKAKTTLTKHLSLLFGNFEVIQVEPLDIKTSEQYLEQKLSGLSLNSGLKNFVVHFSGGYPLYLRVIAEELSKSKEQNLAEILENLLFDASGTLNQRFSNYIKRFQDSNYGNDYISILYLISCGRNKIKDIAHLLHKQQKELFLRINHLLELDTIIRSGDFLRINDRVFSFWLRFIHEEKLNSLTFDARKQKALFKDKIGAIINEFLASTHKPLTERMTELLRLFEDEMIQMERKKIRLDHFREIKQLEFSNGRLKDGLIGRSSDCLWIVGVKKEVLTEEDVADFAKECKKYRHKLQRKVIVTLNDIDANTRLRALEEKVWTWDINNLNLIFDLFSKPGITA